MGKYLKLKIDFRGTASSRTLVLPDDWTFAFLHECIQSAFGWLDYHAYTFTFANGDECLDPDNNWPDVEDSEKEFGHRFFDSDRVPLRKEFKKAGDSVEYEYDMGDGNQFEIRLLGSTTRPEAACIASTGTDAVEDCAGFGGLSGLIKILKAGSRSSQYKDAVGWLSEAFGKTPEAVLREPSASEIDARIHHLVKLVETARLR